MFSFIKVIIASFLTSLALLINPVPKPVPQKPPITVATPSSEIATSAAKTKIFAPTTPVSNNENNNSQLTKNQALKDCLNKVAVFKSAASKMGYQQSEIDGFAQIAEYNCNHPSNKITITPEYNGGSSTTFATPLNTYQNDDLQRQIDKNAKCQRDLLEYSECNAKYTEEVSKYTQCLMQGGRVGTECTGKPYSFCFKPSC